MNKKKHLYSWPLLQRKPMVSYLEKILKIGTTNFFNV